jgi:hypothetical protein
MFEQVGQRGRVGDVVDGDDVQVGAERATQDGPADPAEPIDSDSHAFIVQRSEIGV